MSVPLSLSSEDRALLELRAGKWTLVVVSELRDGTRRFNEIRRSLGGISQKTLSQTLRELERDGFISRTAFATIPPRVDYALTELGLDLLQLVDSFRTFALRNRAAMAAARENFDRSTGIIIE